VVPKLKCFVVGTTPRGIADPRPPDSGGQCAVLQIHSHLFIFVSETPGRLLQRRDVPIDLIVQTSHVLLSDFAASDANACRTSGCLRAFFRRRGNRVVRWKIMPVVLKRIKVQRVDQPSVEFPAMTST